MTIKNATSCINLATIAAILFVCGTLVLYVRSNQRMEEVMENKAIVVALGDELRQSSISLTRNVRMYAVIRPDGTGYGRGQSCGGRPCPAGRAPGAAYCQDETGLTEKRAYMRGATRA